MFCHVLPSFGKVNTAFKTSHKSQNIHDVALAENNDKILNPNQSVKSIVLHNAASDKIAETFMSTQCVQYFFPPQYASQTQQILHPYWNIPIQSILCFYTYEKWFKIKLESLKINQWIKVWST